MCTWHRVNLVYIYSLQKTLWINVPLFIQNNPESKIQGKPYGSYAESLCLFSVKHIHFNEVCQKSTVMRLAYDIVKLQ